MVLMGVVKVCNKKIIQRGKKLTLPKIVTTGYTYTINMVAKLVVVVLWNLQEKNVKSFQGGKECMHAVGARIACHHAKPWMCLLSTTQK